MHRAHCEHRSKQAAIACDHVCRGKPSWDSGHEPLSPAAQSPGPLVVPQWPSRLAASQLTAEEAGERLALEPQLVLDGAGAVMATGRAFTDAGSAGP